jgi:diguanylate cyclase (GGDEF)-like protein
MSGGTLARLQTHRIRRALKDRAQRTDQSSVEPLVAVPSAQFEEETPTEILTSTIQDLARVPKLVQIEAVVTSAARRMTGAAAAALVMREDETADYVAEDSFAPLLKDRQVPLDRDIAGWAIRNRARVAIRNVLADERVDHETYASTFVKSLAIVPIRAHDPVGALGVYWSSPHQPSESELSVLHALAAATSVALENLRLQRMPRVDELTGINNRRGFFEHANTCFDQAAAGDGECAIAVIDVDQLQRVNDEHGHDAGSQVLRDVATALLKVAREDDVIGRLDGDEFALFRPASTEPADDLHRDIALALESTGQESRGYHASSSAGVVALRASSCESLDALLACAGELVNARKRAQGGRLDRSRERA